MADTNLQLKASNALFHLHTTMKNSQIYPTLNPTIINSIETLYLHLLDTLRQDAPVVFAELEKNTELNGEILNPQENEKIPFSYLLDILQGLDVKDISFDKNLGKEELHVFINLAARSQKVALKEEGEEANPTQLQSDDRTFISAEMDQEIIVETDISEDGVNEYISEINKVLGHIKENRESIEPFFSEEQREFVKKTSGQIIIWLEKEASVNLSYKEICKNLQKLIENLIQRKLFAEANAMIDVFNRINTGALKKNDDVREVSLEVLQNLASEKNINILFNEININEKNKTNEACQIFFGFGDIVMNKLLNSVRDASDSKERMRIIHIIQEMGERAIPAIKNSITLSAPWYYLRNMAYILGRIGDENSADILRPLLMHKNKQVRTESLKSIIHIGGSKRGQLLLSVLYQVDQDFRVNIIDTLGKIRCVEAVTDLLYILKSKSTISKDYQISLQEKICNALGTICSSEAIPALSEIAESKSFLGIGSSYPDEVKRAASRALAKIKRI